MPTLEDIATAELSGTVRDVMTQDVQTVTPGTPISRLTDLINEKGLRRVVVVDRNGMVVGVVSQRDILRHYLFSQSRQPGSDEEEDRSSRDIFSEVPVEILIGRRRPVTVRPTLPLLKAAVVLATNKISCLPVVGDDQQLRGLLSVTDLFRYITAYDDQSVESRFTIYTPNCDGRGKSPAYVRRVNGDLVIPRSCIGDPEMVTAHVLLGYDELSSRILVKFVDEESHDDGTIKVVAEKANLVIPARGFVNHFALTGKASAFEVMCQSEGRFLVLAPKSAAKVVSDS